MAKTIFVLTTGLCEDCGIIGVYTTEELAENARVYYPNSEIEEYDLD
jgi:hypothetical protein